MRKILILGGGIYQVPLIRQAVKRGFRVAVASLSANDPGMKLAHDPLAVNLTDHDKILDLVKKHNIEAVTTTGTEFSIPAIGYIHEKYGLPGIGLETATISTNKILAQKRFAETGVPAARFKTVRTLDEAKSAAEEIGYPVFVKAPDSSGSRGISMAPDPGTLQQSFDEAIAVSGKGEALVEEMLTGVEFGAQVIVQDGEVTHCLCHNDTVTPPPVTVPIGHSLPFTETDEIQRDAHKVCEAAVKALGIQNAVCNADLTATSNGVRLFEIGARIGATGLAEIVELYYGINLYDVVLDMAFGDKPDIEESAGNAAAYLILRAPSTGKLTKCAIPDSVSNVDGIVDIHFDYDEGAEVRAFRTGPDRIGHVLLTAESKEAAEKKAFDITESLDIKVQSR